MIFTQPFSVMDSVILIILISSFVFVARSVVSTRSFFEQIYRIPSIVITGTNKIHSKALVKYLSKDIANHSYGMDLGYMDEGKKVQIVSAPEIIFGKRSNGIINELKKMNCKGIVYIFDGAIPLGKQLNAYEAAQNIFDAEFIPVINASNRSKKNMQLSGIMLKRGLSIHRISVEQKEGLDKIRDMIIGS